MSTSLAVLEEFNAPEAEPAAAVEVVPYEALKLADRCDQCGAQAFVRVVHPENKAHDGLKLQDLLFCGHHFHDHQKAGHFKGWDVLDERSKINQTSESSA